MLSEYEDGMERLLDYLGQQHPRYGEALTFQQRLTDNIQHVRRYGDTETRRAERATIVDQLNSLTLDTAGRSFNELCRQPDDMIEMPPPPKFRHRAKLRQVLVHSFNKSELKNMAFDLGVDYENLPGETKEDMARELITYLERRGRVHELENVVRKERPLGFGLYSIWKFQYLIVIFFLIALGIIFAWQLLLPPTELQISSGPTTAKSNLQINEQTQVSVQAEGEGLTYVWSADNGSVSTAGPTAQSTITYTAPAFVGDDWIRVEIRDKKDRVVTGEIKITVVQGP